MDNKTFCLKAGSSWMVVTCLRYLCFLGYFLSSQTLAQVWGENFDGALTPIGASFIRHPLVELVKDEGVDASQSIKVRYEGYELGSRRVVVRAALPNSSAAYTLSFSVKFCQGFDFAKGGKLHGLGPIEVISGGKPVVPLGWSARLVFGREGGLMTYVYHQDQKGKFGDTRKALGFRFKPGRYYRLAMTVELNDPPSSANGKVTVRVDNKVRIVHERLRFRGIDGEAGLIQSLLFSTFHGGGSPEWAPRTADGSYKTDCAYFDDWAVSNYHK